jgi:hypothetical protein
MIAKIRMKSKVGELLVDFDGQMTKIHIHSISLKQLQQTPTRALTQKVRIESKKRTPAKPLLGHLF